MRLARWSWIHRRAAYVAPFVGLVCALPSLARVGSGEHYVGESEPDSDSHGSGDNALAELLLWLVIRHPKVGIPLAVVVLVGVWWVKRNGPSAASQREVAATQRTMVSGSQVEQWVVQIKSRDAAFELLPFLDRARDIFMRAQDAWFKRDLSPLRPFISDANFQRLGVQQFLMAQQGVRDAIADVEVLDLRLVGYVPSPHFDTAHVLIRARMRDADAPANASDAQALAFARQKQPETFLEVWSFVRKPGVQTKAGQDALSGKCPQCGAPYLGGASNKCDHCGAIVNSGLYDWTLAEVTQGQEHRGPHPHVAGLDAAMAADLGLCMEVLEDRAALCFWRWVEAQASMSPKALAKVATPQLLAATIGEGRTRRYFLECAVGSIDAVRIANTGDWQQVDLNIRWSARFAENLNAAASSAPSPQHWRFTLQRKVGAQTPVENGLASSRCPQCGAPLSDNGSPECEYCGQVLASGERDWVLSSAVPL
ncbi:MAG: transporter [Myxococcaceae bacterium]|nr:transporter [Myxococcaceae bacterium]